jgi:hypothetical protein
VWKDKERKKKSRRVSEKGKSWEKRHFYLGEKEHDFVRRFRSLRPLALLRAV